ncbi:Peptidoglycan-binding protein, CsiV [Thiohalospira halophila DSM 15071]|uniref:Peptidoglycan-binding protein, CsiV n=1 Tax=Thiohalospira halophila DSM 15071 TaxID=1123397 RepID=A0A1I1P2E8_9GAMM|nr:CsiV family protein [Thiohalospira halophila]SFD03925.1 Peptidoglycan-binding protein, CsiV [Thiohalospira halophila DSM 15071]
MPRLHKILAPLALLAASLDPAVAADEEGWIGPDEALTWYDVEILVFAHTGEPGAEAWPLEPGLPALAEALTLRPAPESGGEEPPAIGRAPFQRLPPSTYQLKRSWQRLARSEAYRPLLHAAWRQPELPRHAAVPVHLHGGLFWYDDEAEGGVAIEPAVPAAPPWRSEEEEEEEDDEGETGNGGDEDAAGTGVVGPPAPVVDGTLRLVVSRYLHAEVDLLYRDPSPDAETRTYRRPGLLTPEGAERQLPAGFRLQTSRRMRSGEIHYIDHPRFGVLVFVNPWEPEEEEGEAAGEEAGPKAEEGSGAGDGEGTIRR